MPTDPARQAVADQILAGDRRAMAKAITLVESTRADHQVEAQLLLELLHPFFVRGLLLLNVLLPVLALHVDLAFQGLDLL